MGRNTKPGVNWPEIQIKWMSGESGTALAKEYGLTRQAIHQKKNRDGWKRGNPITESCKPENVDKVWLRRAEETDTAKRLSNLQTSQDRQLAAWDKRTPEKLAVILGHLENGVPQNLSAQAAGLSPQTLRSWTQEDDTTRSLVEEAKARSIIRKVTRIEEAGQRGEWNADRWYLERSPETRTEFGQNAAGNSDLRITIEGVAKPGTMLARNEIIDVTPTSAASR